MLKRRVRLFDNISTRPRQRSYQWGGHASYLARATFFGVYALRLLSPLQWIKHAYRQRGQAQSTTNTRPDFPAAFSELYFLVILTLSGAAVLSRHVAGEVPSWVRYALVALAVLLFVESVVWVVYYLLLRSLVEGSYTIYHPAEYLLTFPVLLVTQTLLVSLIWGPSLTTVLGAFTGNPDVSQPLLVVLAALGLVYLTAALSVLMTSHPGIEARRPQGVVVIGAGDVTLNRILPALDFLRVSPSDIVVASLGNKPDARAKIDGRTRIIYADSENTLMAEVDAEQSPAIIASPTNAHFRQIVRLAENGERFAVEKPIVGSAAERDVLRSNPSLMHNGFALSYYVLEKALPLTYFAEPLPTYRKYLISEPPELLDGEAFQFLRDSLGGVTDIEVTLIEGPERSPMGQARQWTEQPPSLRPFVETCIHPLAIVRTYLPQRSPQWTNVRTGVYAPRRVDVGEIAPTFLRAEGTIGTANLTMLVAKHVVHPPPRRIVVEHHRGRLVANFDTRTLEIEIGGRREGTIRVSDVWSQKYAVQMDLVRTFMLKGHGTVRHDDFTRQLDALDWWDSLCEWVELHKVVPFDYDDQIDPTAESLRSPRAAATPARD